MTKLKILDLFSGIGTFSYAFDNVEVSGEKVFETVAFCEMDKDCHRILKKHWPDVPIFTDISQVGFCHIFHGEDYLQQHDEEGKISVEVLSSDIDIIVGGFPCVDISVAGKQKGLVDESEVGSLALEGLSSKDAENQARTRSGLWFEYKRLIKKVKPRYIVIENVRALLSNGFGQVMQDLSDLGYDAEWEVISARDVGQCHLRERIWIVAYPNGGPIRHQSERSESRWNNFQASGKTEPRDLSETGETSSSDTNNYRRLQGVPVSTEIEKESLQSRRVGEDGDILPTDPDSERLERHRISFGDESEISGNGGSSGSIEHNNGRLERGNESPYSDDFRFWPTFTSEEEKRQWWAEATFKFRDWRETQPSVCGVYDGPPRGVHEKFRRARIKQLGNGIVRSIAEIIAERIAYHEFNAEALL